MKAKFLGTLLVAEFLALAECQVTSKLRGHTFKISTYTMRGFMELVKEPDGNYSVVGLGKEYLDTLFDEREGLSYQLVFLSPLSVLRLGVIKAGLKLMLNGEVDISGVGMTPTAERYRFMDFTWPITIDQYHFLLPYPAEESRLWGPIRPFQSQVWQIFLVSLIFVIISLSTIAWLRNETALDRQFWYFLSDNTMFVIRILIGNADYYQARLMSLRFVLGLWCLMCVVLVNSYTGNLTSYLVFPALKSIPNSFEELAASKEYSLIIEDKSVIADQILSASTGALKVIGDSLRAHPSHLFRTAQQADQLLYKYNTVYPGVYYLTYFFLYDNLARTGKCEFTLSHPLPYYLKLSLGLRKHSPYNDAINTRIQYLTEMGLALHLKRMYTPKVGKCLLDDRKKPKQGRLNLVALISAFLLLVCGTGISVVVFIAENIARISRKGNNFSKKLPVEDDLPSIVEIE